MLYLPNCAFYRPPQVLSEIRHPTILGTQSMGHCMLAWASLPRVHSDRAILPDTRYTHKSAKQPAQVVFFRTLLSRKWQWWYNIINRMDIGHVLFAHQSFYAYPVCGCGGAGVPIVIGEQPSHGYHIDSVSKSWLA